MEEPSDGARAEGHDSWQDCHSGNVPGTLGIGRVAYRPADRGHTVLERAGNDSALTSVWEGNDADLIERILEFYPAINPEPILDSTYNAGRFWIGSGRDVETMDIKPVRPVMHECDNREMPGVPSNKFGCVVYDPPHVGANGRDKSIKGFDRDYGAHVVSLKAEGYTLSFLYPPFLAQAHRVLKQEGLLLAKITDQVNNHRSRWAHLDFMTMAQNAGFVVCDLIIKIRRGPMMSSKWKTSHHARKRHCFWIVCRKSSCCEKVK